MLGSGLRDYVYIYYMANAVLSEAHCMVDGACVLIDLVAELPNILQIEYYWGGFLYIR